MATAQKQPMAAGRGVVLPDRTPKPDGISGDQSTDGCKQKDS